MAKLSVNAMIGLWARGTEVVCAQQGADFSQVFACGHGVGLSAPGDFPWQSLKRQPG